MGPAVQAARVTGVPAVGLRRGKSGHPRTAPPPPKNKAGGQGKCSRTTKGGSREPPS